VSAVAAPAATARFRTARFRAGRALRLEIKHSAVVWVLPLLAALFYFDAYRTAAGYPPIWMVRASVITGPNLVFFSVIAAGVAAWVATREGRRKTGDLLATTARAAWARQVTVLAATAFWMVLAYLAGVAVIYIQTASQATWGGPPLWPVAVGVAGMAASCAVGFTCGTLFSSRFTAPIVAVAVFAAWFVGVNAANSVNPNDVNNLNSLKGAPALLVSATGRPQNVDAGVYYHFPPDVSIAQVMVMGGVLLVMVGLLALLPAVRVPGVRGLSLAGRRWLAVAAAVGVACGVAASATAFSLAGTARYSLTTGWEIPALHDAADDQPIPYTLDCTGGAFTVCIHPAFEPYLGAMSAALRPAAAEIAGLPGAPVRAEMTTGAAFPAAAGATSVYDYSTEQEGFGDESFWATPALAQTADWEQGVQQDFITWFVSGPAAQDSPSPAPAQEALAIALLAKIGTPVPPGYPQFSQPGPPGASSKSGAAGAAGVSGTQPEASAAQITAAAQGFESLSSVARRAWLAANIAALRSGAITLAQIP
jgi:ABC-type transport system involved in multi-copper enzyme maturation permease subunit